MTYVGGTTELISRKGYSGLGELKPLPSLAEIQAKAKEEVKKEAVKKEPTTMEKFWKGFATITSPPTKPGVVVAPAARPAWLMPAAIGGGVLVLVLLLRKK